MDVKKGHCWRCEKFMNSSSNVCSLCGIATYCKPQCRQEDQYRHKPECEMWGQKRCCNPGCVDTTGKVRECTACNDAWYCGTPCQRQDWTHHKSQCKECVKAIKTLTGNLRDKFQKRSGGKVPFSRLYYIGNTIASDMLNLAENECKEGGDQTERETMLTKEYNILSVGCGNLRNTIHTMACLPEEFLGTVNVTLNDMDPFVQARNVLFLYMMTAFSSQSNVAATVTTIWYSLHLSSDDYQFVVNCLRDLTGYTGSTLSAATAGLVRISEEDMKPLREVWNGWLALQCLRSHPDSINLQKQRQEVFQTLRKQEGSDGGVELYKKEIPKKYMESVDEWFDTGVFQRPTSTQMNKNTTQYDNPTLTGYYLPCNDFSPSESPRQRKFVYCVNSDSVPFGEWDQILVEKYIPRQSCITMYHAYITDQIRSAVQVLARKGLATTVQVSNCLEMPAPQEASFDRIFTSNLSDFLGTQTLLRALKPLLNRGNAFAIIVTQYQNWHIIFPQAMLSGELIRTIDGTFTSCMQAAAKDTAYDFKKTPHDNKRFMAVAQRNAFFLQEYFNDSPYFVKYLRAEYMACEKSVCKDGIVSIQTVAHFEGLQMRDFRRGLNTVLPFANRRHARSLCLNGGMVRIVEWHLQK